MSERLPAERFPPGGYIRERLEARRWTPPDLAATMGVHVIHVREIIAGEAEITPDIAEALAKALGTSAEFWLNLEAAYQETPDA